jgi:hypothetical protein
MTTTGDLLAPVERLFDATEATRSMPPRRERRASHRFQVAASPFERLVSSDVCAACGYGEAGHLGLTDLEQHAVADLLSQLQSSPFMRRRILRKLAIS